MSRYEYIYEIVKDADGVDCFVKHGEVIRCRDCKYAHLTYDGDCKQCDKWLDDDDFHLTLYLDGDFYCGYAERKE